jgi:hypothetical protein
MSRLGSVVQILLDMPALPGINGMTPDEYYAFRSFSDPEEAREYFDGVSTDERKEFESSHFEVPLQVSGIVTPEQRKNVGVLVQSSSVIWVEIVRRLHKNWEHAFEIAPREWEEIIAGAFDKAGFDEVILTPRSGDFGRDVIAVKKGFGSIKIIGSVKAFKGDT